MADINELEEQIAKLPVGYIIEKVINDKKYYYQQWKENGKSKSRYISEEEANTLKPQIEERKKLQKELKALKRIAEFEAEESADQVGGASERRPAQRASPAPAIKDHSKMSGFLFLYTLVAFSSQAAGF